MFNQYKNNLIPEEKTIPFKGKFFIFLSTKNKNSNIFSI
jgi:hypothetical protein